MYVYTCDLFTYSIYPYIATQKNCAVLPGIYSLDVYGYRISCVVKTAHGFLQPAHRNAELS